MMLCDRQQTRSCVTGGRGALGACLVILAAVAQPAAAGPPELGWRGIVRALHQPTLTSELVAPIARIGFREGERFAKGDVLIEFDCRRHRQELAALASGVREAKVVVQTNSYLEQRGASNANDVEIARARHDKAVAEHGAMDQRLSGCSLAAPFDGVVVELGVAAHETPAPAKPLMVIASTGYVEIELIVEARALSGLRIGTPLLFLADAAAEPRRAEIARIGGAVDPVSQTVKVYAAFTGERSDIRPGQSGIATAAVGER